MNRTKEIGFASPSFPIAILPGRSACAQSRTDGASAIHEAIEIKCFFEGEATLLIGDETVHAVAGDVVVINPYEFHTTLDCSATDGKYHLVMVGLDFFSGDRAAGLDLRALTLGRRAGFVRHHVGDAELCRRISELVAEHGHEDAAARLAIYGAAAQLFARLLRLGVVRSPCASGEGIARYYGVIEPAVRLIRDEYQRPFTVEELAAACGVSRYHFCRIFREVMGEAPIRYLNSYRLKIAATMLRLTDRPVGEIALACGFGDISYFSRLYRRELGRTPLDTRCRDTK